MRTLPQRRPLPLIRAVLQRAAGADAGTLAAALTYQGLLSAPPLLLLGGAVVGFVFADDPERVTRWLDTVATVVPGIEGLVGDNVQALVEARVQAGAIAIAALAWTGSSLAGRAAHAAARIFGLPERPWYRSRLWALLELAVLLTAGLVGLGLTGSTSAGGGALTFLAGLVLDLGLALLAYVVLTPPGGPSVRGHLPGAIALGATWTAVKLAGGWYAEVVVARASVVYGTIAAIIGVLAILSIAAHAFVYGAALSAVWEDGATPATLEPPAAASPPRARGGRARS